jgi:PAS domain S-box-containing protein
MDGVALLKYTAESVEQPVTTFIDELERTREHLAQEVTEREFVEEALRESVKRFRDIAFSIDGWIWETDEEGVYTYCSEKIEEILGYSVNDIVGKSMFDLMLPDEAETARQKYKQIKENREPIKDLESWNLHKDSSLICILTNGVPILDENENLIGYRGVDKDITQQKRIEAERERLITDLEDALSKIKTLKGLIPICASCKKIRDDKGYWNKLENYIEIHSNAEFSHGICPDCLERLYPNLMKNGTSNVKCEK